MVIDDIDDADDDFEAEAVNIATTTLVGAW